MTSDKEMFDALMADVEPAGATWSKPGDLSQMSVDAMAARDRELPGSHAQQVDRQPHPFTRPDGSEAEMFIQWKGTDLCMDFYCPCGTPSHLDSSFAYFVRCPSCNSVWELGTQVIVKRNEDGRGSARDLELDDEDDLR